MALFELAQELTPHARDKIAEDIHALRLLLEESADLQKMVRSPLLQTQEQETALRAVLAKGGADDLVQNFSALVVRNRRGFALHDMTRHFATLMAESRDEMVAAISAAKPLSDTQIDTLKQELKKIYNKTIIIEETTDKTLLGGLVVKIGSRMIDGSLRRKLELLENALNTVK